MLGLVEPETYIYRSLGGASLRAQELCENRDGRPGLPGPNADGRCGRKATFKVRNWAVLSVTLATECTN